MVAGDGTVPVEVGEAVGVWICLQGRALTRTLTGWIWLYVGFTAPLRGGRDHSHFRVQSPEAKNRSLYPSSLREVAAQCSPAVSGAAGEHVALDTGWLRGLTPARPAPHKVSWSMN